MSSDPFAARENRPSNVTARKEDESDRLVDRRHSIVGSGNPSAAQCIITSLPVTAIVLLGSTVHRGGADRHMDRVKRRSGQSVSGT